MKTRTPLIAFALAALFLTGCSKSNLQVISAVYGSGANYADVSVRVSDLVLQTSGFNAKPDWLQADPSPGWNKTLVIVYEIKGHRHVFVVEEGGSVSAAILREAGRQ